MSEWSVQDWLLFIGAIATFLTATLLPAVLAIIRAVKENTAITLNAANANLMDRERTQAQTLEALKPIATQINDLHLSGTGNGTTVVNVPPPAPPEPTR